jgi:hypothetical protein
MAKNVEKESCECASYPYKGWWLQGDLLDLFQDACPILRCKACKAAQGEECADGYVVDLYTSSCNRVASTDHNFNE